MEERCAGISLASTSCGELTLSPAVSLQEAS